MRRSTTLVALAIAAVVLALAGVAGAAEWGNIIPGTSNLEAVRAQWGSPTRTTTQKVEGYDSVQWVYEGNQAPHGVRRLVVDFGLLTPGGYKADLVRTFRLEPRLGAFNRDTIVNGWGDPDWGHKEGETVVFVYQAQGLLVYFDKEGWNVQALVFTPRQPPAAAGERKP